MTADKWYEHHTVSDPGGCTLVPDASAFDCGDVGARATASFTIVGTTNDAGTFKYEVALRELARPFDYVRPPWRRRPSDVERNDHCNPR